MTNYFAPPKPARINLVDILLIAIPVTVVMVYVITGPLMERLNARRYAAAESGAKMLSLAILQYQQDHGDHLPPADGWENALRPYVLGDYHASMDEFLKLPVPYWERPRRFAFNRTVGGKSLAGLEHPDNVVLFYESSLSGPNAADALTHPASTDSEGIVILFPEGSHPDGITEYASGGKVNDLFQASHVEEAKLR